MWARFFWFLLLVALSCVECKRSGDEIADLLYKHSKECKDPQDGGVWAPLADGQWCGAQGNQCKYPHEWCSAKSNGGTKPQLNCIKVPDECRKALEGEERGATPTPTHKTTKAKPDSEESEEKGKHTTVKKIRSEEKHVTRVPRLRSRTIKGEGNRKSQWQIRNGPVSAIVMSSSANAPVRAAFASPQFARSSGQAWSHLIVSPNGPFRGGGSVPVPLQGGPEMSMRVASAVQQDTENTNQRVFFGRGVGAVPLRG